MLFHFSQQPIKTKNTVGKARRNLFTKSLPNYKIIKNKENKRMNLNMNTNMNTNMNIFEALYYINTIKEYKRDNYSDKNSDIAKANNIMDSYKSIIQEDEAGNIYTCISPYEDDYFGYYKIFNAVVTGKPGDNLVVFISSEIVAELKDRFKVSFYEDAINWDSGARRPYYRLRGKKVTKEQAFDVISRTDGYCSDLNSDLRYNDIKRCHNDKQVFLLHFANWWLNKNHYPQQMGWIRPSGIVGGNGITDKYPDIFEVFDDIMDIVLNFPYLEFVVGITYLDEGVLDWSAYHPVTLDDSDTEEFAELLDLVISVVNGEIKFLTGEEAIKEYTKYASVFEDKNTDIYNSDYFENTGNNEIDSEFIFQAQG